MDQKILKISNDVPEAWRWMKRADVGAGSSAILNGKTIFNHKGHKGHEGKTLVKSLP